MRWLLPVALGCLALSGCGKKEPASPADVVRSYIKASQETDLATLRRLTGGSELSNAFHRYVSVAVDFKRRMISEYGEEDWKAFAEGGAFTMSVSFPADDLVNLQEDIRGDTATVTLPNGRRVSLKRTDGRWQVDFDKDYGGSMSGFAKGADPIKFWRGFRQMLETNLPLIGRSGVTPDTLDAKMNKEFMAMTKAAR